MKYHIIFLITILFFVNSCKNESTQINSRIPEELSGEWITDLYRIKIGKDNNSWAEYEEVNFKGKYYLDKIKGNKYYITCIENKTNETRKYIIYRTNDYTLKIESQNGNSILHRSSHYESP